MNRIQVSLDLLRFNAATALGFSLFSILLLEFYQLGDLRHYRALFESLSVACFGEINLLSRQIVDGKEPLAAATLWAGAKLGFSHDYFVAILNFLLVFNLGMWLARNGVTKGLILLILSNFYIIVLITAAERLKIGMLIVTFGLWGGVRARFFCAMLSFLGHMQGLFLVYGAIGSRLTYIHDRFLEFKIDVNGMLLALCFIFAAFFSFIIFSQDILNTISKFLQQPIHWRHFFGLSIIGTSLVFVKDKRLRNQLLALCLAFFPIFVVFGSNRINMFLVILTVYFFVENKETKNPFFIALCLYFSVKGVAFAAAIFVHGNGFSSLF